MLYFSKAFNVDLAPSHFRHMDIWSERWVNLVWHKLVRAVQKDFSKTCLLNKLLAMFYLKYSHCQQRTQQTSALWAKGTARAFLLALPGLLALVQLHCVSQVTEQNHAYTHGSHVRVASCDRALYLLLVQNCFW